MLNELLKLLEKGPDNAMLRLSIGSAYLKMNEIDQALEHLAKAVELDPRYSAAWKLYGKALLQNGDVGRAETALERGVRVATDRGDIQAVREMEVFLKRLRKGA
ncbi:MAG: tetratricopeptide repeat protein [Gammaproteobacteria bacterium]|nr:tetratricopeptide repeat protein [Gammaproteobacteria bacterium]